MNVEKIKISYKHIDRVIGIPYDYDELLETFIEKFKADEDKEYLFFFKDNDNINNEDVKEKDYIKKDVCFSDFENKKKIYVVELKNEKEKEEEYDTETEIGSKNLSESSYTLNSNESLKTHNIYFNIEKELSKQTEDNSINKIDKDLNNEDKDINDNDKQDKFFNINSNTIIDTDKLVKLIKEVYNKNRELALKNNKMKK